MATEIDIIEFELPKSEVDAAVNVGEFGKISIPVEVIEVGDKIKFRKNGKASAEDMFKPEPLNDMRERMGVTDEPEKSMIEEDD